MSTTVSAEVLAAQLELADLLWAGRDRMLNPQDLPGRYGRVIRSLDHLLQAIHGAPSSPVAGQSGGTVTSGALRRMSTLSCPPKIWVRCWRRPQSAASKCLRWLPACGPSFVTRKPESTWIFSRKMPARDSCTTGADHHSAPCGTGSR